MHRDQDCKTDDGDADGEDGEAKAMTGFVAQVGEEHGEAEGGGPGGHGVQLCLDFAVAVAVDYCGAEVGVAWRDAIRKWRVYRLEMCLPYAGTMRPKYMKPPIQILKSLKTLATSLAPILRSAAEDPCSARRRLMTKAFSSPDSHLLSSGKSGRRK